MLSSPRELPRAQGCDSRGVIALSERRGRVPNEKMVARQCAHKSTHKHARAHTCARTHTYLQGYARGSVENKKEQKKMDRQRQGDNRNRHEDTPSALKCVLKQARTNTCSERGSLSPSFGQVDILTRAKYLEEKVIRKSCMTPSFG